MDYSVLAVGDTGAVLIKDFNDNFSKTETKISSIDSNINGKVSGNTIKALKVESGIFYYTVDNTNWVKVNDNSWGSITGTISNQVDLVNLVNTKASTTVTDALSTRITTNDTSIKSINDAQKVQDASIASNTTAIGSLQSSISTKVSSSSIKSFRISSSGYLEYSLNGVSWVTVQSLSDINWGSIGGEITNQTDLQSSLNSKANTSVLTAHTSNTANPHNVTKSQVGLGNVDNTADVDKPVSTIQAAAINAVQTQVTDLNNNKVANANKVTAIEYITLENYNAKITAGTISDTTLYIVEE